MRPTVVAPDAPADERAAGLPPDVVRAAQQGDAHALNDVLGELEPYLGRICGAVALDHGDDALQETFIAVFKGLPRLQAPDALFGWARVIAVRESVRVAKKAKRSTSTLVADEDLERIAGDLTAHRRTPSDHATDTIAIRATLESLAPEQRAILVLRDLGEATEQQVAEAFEIPLGTVKSRVHRARDAFKKKWQP